MLAATAHLHLTRLCVSALFGDGVQHQSDVQHPGTAADRSQFPAHQCALAEAGTPLCSQVLGDQPRKAQNADLDGHSHCRWPVAKVGALDIVADRDEHHQQAPEPTGEGHQEGGERLIALPERQLFGGLGLVGGQFRHPEGLRAPVRHDCFTAQQRFGAVEVICDDPLEVEAGVEPVVDSHEVVVAQGAHVEICACLRRDAAGVVLAGRQHEEYVGLDTPVRQPDVAEANVPALITIDVVHDDVRVELELGVGHMRFCAQGSASFLGDLMGDERVTLLLLNVQYPRG